MSLYTITINPEDGSGAQTTVCVDIDGDDTRITELIVKAPSGSGLSTHQLPAVDLDLLLRAVLPPDAERAAVHAPEPDAESATPPARRAVAQAAGRRASAGATKKRQRSKRVGTATVSALGGRAYRRMPDDLAEVYEQNQSVTAVAKHYDVPRHTAQGWMNRLRERARGQ